MEFCIENISKKNYGAGKINRTAKRRTTKPQNEQTGSSALSSLLWIDLCHFHTKGFSRDAEHNGEVSMRQWPGPINKKQENTDNSCLGHSGVWWFCITINTTETNVVVVCNFRWHNKEDNSHKIGEAVIKIGGLEVAISQSMCVWPQLWQQIVRDGSFLHQNITCYCLSKSTC